MKTFIKRMKGLGLTVESEEFKVNDKHIRKPLPNLTKASDR
jgi:hypothetical protein